MPSLISLPFCRIIAESGGRIVFNNVFLRSNILFLRKNISTDRAKIMTTCSSRTGLGDRKAAHVILFGFAGLPTPVLA